MCVKIEPPKVVVACWFPFSSHKMRSTEFPASPFRGFEHLLVVAGTYLLEYAPRKPGNLPTDVDLCCQAALISGASVATRYTYVGIQLQVRIPWLGMMFTWIQKETIFFLGSSNWRQTHAFLGHSR